MNDAADKNGMGRESAGNERHGKTMVEAINRALREVMEEDERVVVIGQDVGVDGGVFRVTDGLIDEFGSDRVIDSPLAESAIAGVSIGMALNGLRPVAEMQFSGFSYLAFAQVEGHAARLRWRSRGGLGVPMVVRMPYGAGVRALEHHSESREAFYGHVPGLKTVIPASPRRAHALLHAAIRDPDPVIFMEPKALYRSFREDLPEAPDEAEIGRARIVQQGEALTIIAWGAMLRPVLKAAARLAEEAGEVAEVIDLETIAPIDAPAIADSVSRTGRLLIVTEAPLSYGPAGEVAMRAIEGAFFSLRAPICRVTGWDTHVPFFAREQSYLPSPQRIFDAARELLKH
ncbi:alpha-ketoacid dehydrogenase subunit beta [Limibaculum sp. M0105]|uniref:Alpha-ketoacid dehydrogenase subunit beta n=1 Tax=Thermohalobaculum xanthum TaxID=2753746 RepID=A0A8J7M7S4_9RHOB|nr:alpha-ketoacid dehydrogenase subunit beta [Thermohalobaculum xanthum]MBK0400151.1 alpha-ketoacid dehydrogenase subunit beta [Thermohalobaculum xanthum]